MLGFQFRDAWPWEPGMGVKTVFMELQSSPLITYQNNLHVMCSYNCKSHAVICPKRHKTGAQVAEGSL